MTKYHASLQAILAEVESFLNDTLEKEPRLSAEALTHRDKILASLLNFRHEYPAMFAVKPATNVSKPPPLPSRDNIPARETDLTPANIPVAASITKRPLPRIPTEDSNTSGETSSEAERTSSAARDSFEEDIYEDLPDPEAEMRPDVSSDEAEVRPALPTRRPVPAGQLEQPKKEEEDRKSLGGKSDSSDGQARDLPVRDLTDVHKFGFLLKRRKEKVLFTSEYQKRFCVVAGSTFYYYEKDTDPRPQGSFSLKDYEARDATGGTDKKKADVTFVLTCPGQRTYQFQTENRRDQEDWKRIINFTVPDWLNANGSGGGAETIPDTSNATLKPPLLSPPSSDSEYLGMYITPTAPSEVQQYYDETLTNVPAPKPPQPIDEFYSDAISCSTTGSQQAEPPEIYYTDASSANSSGSFLHSSAAVTATVPPSANKGKQQRRELPPIPAEEKQAANSRGPLPPAPSSEQVFNDQSVDYENYYYAKWDCRANNPDELSFSQGDEIHIIGKEYDKYNWWVGELNGRLGIVPKTFLQPAFELVSN